MLKKTRKKRRILSEMKKFGLTVSQNVAAMVMSNHSEKRFTRKLYEKDKWTAT